MDTSKAIAAILAARQVMSPEDADAARNKVIINAIQQKMLDHFGATKNPREAGYIIDDGQLLDLSGRHYATGYENKKPLPGQPDYLRGQRNVDHRELPEDLDFTEVQSKGNALRFSDINGDLNVQFHKGQNITPDQWKALQYAHKLENRGINYDIQDINNVLDSGSVSSINKLMNITKNYLPAFGFSVSPLLDSVTNADYKPSMGATRSFGTPLDDIQAGVTPEGMPVSYGYVKDLTEGMVNPMGTIAKAGTPLWKSIKNFVSQRLGR